MISTVELGAAIHLVLNPAYPTRALARNDGPNDLTVELGAALEHPPRP